MSRLDLIAGPNGAGKTTLFQQVIAIDRPGLPFVNPDYIAHERFPGEETANAYAAAEIATTARAALIEARIDFCTETVFSHASKVELVEAAVAAQYDIVLHVVMIPLRLSAARVATRAHNGGHNVPGQKLAGRYERLWPLIAQVVAICHRTVFYNNAHDDGPTEVASFRYGFSDYPPQWPTWTAEAITAL